MGEFKHKVLNTIDLMINRTKKDLNYMSIDELNALLDLIKKIHELSIREQSAKAYVFFSNEAEAISAECCSLYFPLEINCLILEKEGDKDGSRRNAYMASVLTPSAIFKTIKKCRS